MPFILKKLLAALLLPLPIGLCFIFIGLLWLWISRGKKMASVCISLGFLILCVFSSNFISLPLANQLEQQYAPLTDLPKVNDIVVLGGGVRSNPNLPPNTQLQSASLSRLVEAMRLYRLYKRHHQSIQLVLSGGRVFGSMAEAGVLENTATLLGVDPKDVILENGSEDTYQETIYIKKIVGHKPFILVTSATHMPRAMALFKQEGLFPIPAPTQYMAQTTSPFYNISQYVPNSKNLVLTDIALHEYIGQWCMKLH